MILYRQCEQTATMILLRNDRTFLPRSGIVTVTSDWRAVDPGPLRNAGHAVCRAQVS
jgi:hypothetical protein